ncbi:hypothetical protein [Curtobacterium sp. VKM Ac-2887]|uniref:hypothetical protein n=1 Tax=Curtobacterium sp. VKM Ac-2887 TaxID=2783819 RepID=UPI001A08DC05|nr:hypothetical protein [Curtobacterium sp. VKM Ac-2887]MBF4586681.1 hypothetical protein [Curtobacterium sp. VKM Ac-2887]
MRTHAVRTHVPTFHEVIDAWNVAKVVRAAVDAGRGGREARGGAATGLPAATWSRRAGADG